MSLTPSGYRRDFSASDLRMDRSGVPVAVRTVPLVSIGLPTFNRGVTLSIAIESALAQEYRNIELVISDNASTDETQRVCENFAAADSRVKYSRQQHNCGMTQNFREVLSLATGEYFMWLSDDDRLDHTYVGRCLDALGRETHAALVCGVSQYYNGEQLAFTGTTIDLHQESRSERVLAYYRQVNDNGTFYGLARRELLTKQPLHNTIGGDWMFIASMAFQGKVTTIRDAVLYRSSKGISSDLSALAMSFGISKSRAARPYQRITESVFSDIVRGSPVFSELSLFSRWLLALRVARVLYGRFLINEHPVPRLTNKIRFRLKIRTRLKHALRIE
jgi:glycosyltransferase involved in cell wall biosynthesis